jgi:hypothetical protein
MNKLLTTLKQLVNQSFLVLFSIAMLTSVLLIQPSYATTYNVDTQTEDKVIQPFELTQPATNREEAYEKVAKTVKDPVKLDKAENKEVKAEISAYKQGRPSDNLLNKAEEPLTDFKK